MSKTDTVRRQVKTRDSRWAHSAAAWLRRRGLRPNQISVAGVFFAFGGGVACWALPRVDSLGLIYLLCFMAILGIQGRLLCNLFDGMVAIEGGLKSRSGELFNDFPDRLSDSFLLIGAGYAIGTICGVALGFSAAILAMLTAYARVLGGAAGGTQRFLGPMAKQHRMALLTLAILVTAATATVQGGRSVVLTVALAIIALGSLITTMRRLYHSYRELESGVE